MYYFTYQYFLQLAEYPAILSIGNPAGYRI
jgi:hypothetical protein